VDDLINYLSAHPVVLVVIAAVALLFIYFVFRGMLKLILITGLVLVALYGYHYYNVPEKFPETVDRIGNQCERVIEAGKDVVEKGRELADRVGETIKEKRSASEDE